MCDNFNDISDPGTLITPFKLCKQGSTIPSFHPLVYSLIEAETVTILVTSAAQELK